MDVTFSDFGSLQHLQFKPGAPFLALSHTLSYARRARLLAYGSRFLTERLGITFSRNLGAL